MNSAFRGTCANGLNQIVFKVTIGTILGKKTSHQVLFPSSFLDNERKVSAFCLKIFIGFPKVLSFHLSMGTILGKNFPKNWASSIIFASWTKFFGLQPKFFQLLSKLHSTCAEEHVGEKFNVLKNLEFGIVFGQGVNNCRRSRKIFL